MLDLLRFIKSLRRVMPLADAVKLALSKTHNRTIEVRVNGVSSVVTLRGGTTDIKCFQQVFQFKEYIVPFKGDFDPQFIIDAGANIGLAAVFFASQYPDAKILAIEPESSNFAILERNCANYPNIKPVKAALWPDREKLCIASTTDGSWASRVSPNVTSSIGEVKAISVSDAMTILGANKLDILKLDIEGSEKRLFENGPSEWLDRVSVIIIELHDRIEPGCAKAFYAAIGGADFHQEVWGENVFVRLR